MKPAIEALPALPRDENGPLFAEPWQAQAFAMAVKLCEQGHFTRDEWVARFAAAIKAAEAAGGPGLGDRYYHHWLAALEGICADKGLVLDDERGARKEQWRRAYLATAHGQPIDLAAGAPMGPPSR